MSTMHDDSGARGIARSRGGARPTPRAAVPPSLNSQLAFARKVAHLTPEERVARGKAARNDVPRSTHAGWRPAADRPDPVALLEEQATSRVPELVPIRYGRMLVRRSRSIAGRR